MSRSTLIVALASAALALYAAWRLTEAPALAAAATFLLGWALALGYDRGFPGRERDARRNAVLLALASAAALLLLGAVDELVLPGSLRFEGPTTPAVDAAERVLPVAWALPAVPLLVGVLFPARSPQTEPPLWPIAAGLLGGLGLDAASWFAWGALLRPALTGHRDAAELAAAAAPTMAFVALGGAVAGCAWIRAIRRRDDPRFDGRGTWARTVDGVTAALTLGVAVLLAAAAAGAVTGDAAVAAPLVVLLSLCWMAALRRTRALEPAAPLPAVLAVAAWAVALWLSFAPALLLLGTREWAPLALLLFGPVALAAGVAVLRYWPIWAARLTAGEAPTPDTA